MLNTTSAKNCSTDFTITSGLFSPISFSKYFLEDLQENLLISQATPQQIDAYLKSPCGSFKYWKETQRELRLNIQRLKSEEHYQLGFKMAHCNNCGREQKIHPESNFLQCSKCRSRRLIIY